MSFVALRAALAATPQTATARFILIVLADFANDAGEAWPSIPTLAARTALSERSVRRALRLLEEEGFIERRERRGRRNSNVYSLRLSANAQAKTGQTDRFSDQKPVTMTGQTCQSDRSKPASLTTNPLKRTTQRPARAAPDLDEVFSKLE